MATQQELNQLKSQLAQTKRGTPEYKALLQQFNEARQAMGRDKVTAKEAQQKASNFVNRPQGQNQRQMENQRLNLKGQNLGNAKGILQADYGIQQEIADQNVQLGSPGTQINPFGTQNITRDAQGNIIVNQQLSEAQQGILNRDQQLSMMGRDAASNLFGGYVQNLGNRTLGSDMLKDRQRMEDQVFASLTRGMGEQKQRDMQQLQQTLHNRGIPVGSDLYNQQMQEFNRSYADRELAARGQATQLGGQELERGFGIQENLLKNQLGELGYLGQFGSGFQAPNFQGYQGVQMQAPSALQTKTGIMGAKDNRTALDIQREQLDIERQKVALQQQALAKQGGGGAPRTPFNPTLPPGAS